MKTLILKILPLWLMVIWAGAIRAQINTAPGAVTSCPGAITVPINVTNCNGVGAISLVLQFDTSKLTYTGYQNLNGALSSGMLSISTTGNVVIFGWANTTAASPGTGTLVQLKFNAVPGTPYLNWDTQTAGACEYADINGNVLAATFTNGSATIQQPPLINTQPVNSTILVGQNTSFSVSAIGTGLAYLWQISTNGGGIWNDLTNSPPYSGVTTATLSLTNLTLAYNGYKYRCRLTGTCTPVIYTDVVTLTVVNPVTTTLPTVSQCPGNITVPVTVTNFTNVGAFSLTFSFNPGVLTYTGYQSLNGALSGGNFVANVVGGTVYLTWSSATGATFGNGTLVELLFTAATGASPLTWDVVNEGMCEYASAAGGILTSVWVNGAETIYGLPAVTVHPVNKTIAKGQNTSFSITATGTGLSYLWQYSSNGGVSFSDLANSGTYSGVTTATLSITSAQLVLSGYQYRCRVTGTCTPVAFSNPGILTVLPNIITTCGSTTVCPGQMIIPVNVTDFIGVASFSLALAYNASVFTYNGYQNLHSALAGGSFVANASGGKVYLTWSNTSAATIPTGGLLIELKFSSIPGTGNFTWDTQTPGNCEYVDLNGLVVYSTWNNGSGTVNLPPAIGTQPVNRTMYANGSTNFSITATGTGLTYLWQVSTNGGSIWTNLTNTVPYSGVNTATLTINPVATGMNGYQYHCIVTGSCPLPVTSDPGILTVTQTLISTTIGSITSSCNGNLNVPINVTNCNNVGSISLVLIFDTTKLTFDTYHSVNAGLSGGMMVVNRYANRVIFSWASTSVANLGSGLLVYYRFQAISGISTTLTWDTQTPGACEYADPAGTVIASSYVNGTVTVNANALIANAGNDVTMVYNSVQLNGTATGGTPPYTWIWSPAGSLSNPNIANPVATPTVTTTYTLTVTDNAGCSSTDPVTVTVPPVLQDISLQNIVVPNGSYVCYNATQTITVAGGGTTFVVQNGGEALMIAGLKINYLPGTKVNAGGYLHGWITTTNQYCNTLPPTLAPVISAINEPEVVGSDHGSDFRIYPNPTTGSFTLSLTGQSFSGSARVTVYGSCGEAVLTAAMNGSRSQAISLAGKPAGLYFVRVTDGTMGSTRKLILQP